jgi:hypothetical protein
MSYRFVKHPVIEDALARIAEDGSAAGMSDDQINEECKSFLAWVAQEYEMMAWPTDKKVLN